GNPAARKRGFLQQHHRIERVVVLRERVGDEAVVSGIHGGGEEASVEAEYVVLVVVLVLVAAATRDLDDHIDHAIRVHRPIMLPGTVTGWSSAVFLDCRRTSSRSSTA